ncbi:MAG TPA: acyl-CoA dehydrogenase family protein [Stellaceae bacterium]
MTAPPLEADGDIRPDSSPIDYLGRVAALAPLITASIEQIERDRRLPQPLVDGMIEAGLFRLLVPRPLDGGEIDPVGFVRVIEAVAQLDASTAWCLCQTAVCGMVGAFLAPEAAWEIFGRDPRAVLAWGAGPGGRAMPVEGGYRVTGTWPFASGGHHATWLGGHCLVLQPDGTSAVAASGAAVVRTMLFPASQVAMTDNWNVIGLKGTGSDTYSVNDIFVPAAHSLGRDDPADRRRNTPLYHLRTDNMFSSGFASLTLGVARGMLEALIALAKDKSPRGLKQTMRESAVVQSDVGELEARLRATRHYLLGTLVEVWEAVERTHQLTIDHRMAIRLAASRTIHESRDVANACYHAAGATAVFAGNPFERRFRDIHAIAQQLQGRRAHYETVGKFLLGLEADTAFL